MPKFKDVNPREDLVNQELDILEFWDKQKIFQKSLAQRINTKRYIFFEGPPTANAKPGIHHVESRAFKDLWPRFKTMQGYLVDRKAGWDTHGLPVELAIEKKLGLTNKTDIEKYGIAKFNAEAKKSVWEFKEIWDQSTRRLGFWLDLDNPYITYDTNYVESLWWIIKQIWDKELLYFGYKIVPQCPRCGTSLSSHEVAQGYQNIEENSIYLKCKLKDETNTFILVWTTTPWTLPGNVALAINPDITYVKVDFKGEKLILAKDLLEAVMGEGANVIEEFSGKKLIGKEYEPLFPRAIETQEKGWYVASGDFVTTTDGTGVVHIAPMYGEDDYNLGKSLNLPMVHTVNEEGLFLPSVTKWAGKFVKDPEVEKNIVTDLASRNLLFKEAPHAHDCPFCWRCNTSLLYYAKHSWMIAMTKLKKELIKENNNVNWVPEHIKKGRFGEWLENVVDWAFSRERYWGTPLPLWKNEAGEYICIGSFAQLKELAKDKSKVGDDFDPHRPFIDEIVLVKDGQEYKRVPEVIDTWFDSGAMPFAQWHYPFENKERIDKGISYPADFISEAQDQTRGWFYTLLAIAVLLGYPTPYKNVLVLGMVLDKAGKKMSKSKGNVIDPEEIFKKYSADVARWYFYSVNQPCDSKLFDEEMLSQIIRRFILTLWNTYSFFVTYANLDNFDSAQTSPKTTNVLDQWIVAKSNQLIEIVTESLEKYDSLKAALAIESFVSELSNWYVRRSRKRFWRTVRRSLSEGGKSTPLDSGAIDKQQAYQTLYQTLKTLALILAPFMPFIAEAIYQNLRTKEDPESVHLCDWPKVVSPDTQILDDMQKVREIVELGHHLREKEKIKVRQPLSELQVTTQKLPVELVEIITEELNVKQVVFGAQEDKLNTEITPELEQEGIAREFVRAIQVLRKDKGLDVSDRINLSYYPNNDTKALNELLLVAVDKFSDYIKGEILAVTFEPAKSESGDNKIMIKVGDKTITTNIQLIKED